MKVVHPSECSLIVHISANTVAAVPLWELENRTLVWAKSGIHGEKDPADAATGRVTEWDPPDRVEVEDFNLLRTRNLLVRVPPDCVLEIRSVIVADKLVVA
jgi:hypothetical protein